MAEGQAVRVCVRARPLLQREMGDQLNLFWKVEKSKISQVDGAKSFNFDRVFDSSETTNQVYQEMAVPIIRSVLHGYHGTIFAYGQTSSGKTYTMMGTAEAVGIVPQAVQDIFKIIQEIPNREFLLRVSYMEIYNETVTDLLCDDSKKKPLEIREDLHRNVYVADLTEEIVMIPDHVMKWIKKGEKNRRYGETKMNEHSSRSHTIFRMIIESRDRSEPGNSENCDGAVMVSHLSLVDLAGSERASQTGAEGVRLKEGCNINRSLFILGQVIKKLSDGQAGGFINYRDSKLTRILQNSLGGNTKTLIICTVRLVSFDETLSTLQFASTAKHVRNTPHVNEVVDDQALLKRYRKEIMDLKKQLEQLEASSGARTHATAKEENAQLLAEIQQLQKERQNRIWNLTNIIIASSQESEQDQRVKRKRRVTWAPGKLQTSLGSCGFSDSDVLSKLSYNKRPKFSDLTLLTEVDDSICTEFSDFDEMGPESDLTLSKVTTRETAAYCQSMVDMESEEPFLSSNQLIDSSPHSKEMEQKISDLECQLKKMTEDYESESKAKESFASEIVSLKEQLRVTNLEGHCPTVETSDPVKKGSIDLDSLSSEVSEIQGNTTAALEEISCTLGNHNEEQEIKDDNKSSREDHSMCNEQITMLEQKILDLEQVIETLNLQSTQDEEGKSHTEDLMESVELCEALMTEKGNALEEMNIMRDNFDSVILENESFKREITELQRLLSEKTETNEFEVLEREMQKEQEAQLAHEIVSLKKVVENAEVYNQDLESELGTKSNLLKDQEKQILELKKTVDILQKRVRNEDLSFSLGDGDKLCEEVFRLKQSLADAEVVTRDAQKESAFLRSENRELKEKMDHMSIHCQQREKDASFYEKQLESEKAKFKQMQADLQKELQCAFNEINHLSGLMAGKVPKDLLSRVELEKEIRNHSKQLATIAEEKCVLEQEVASLSEYKSLPNEIEHLKAQICSQVEVLEEQTNEFHNEKQIYKEQQCNMKSEIEQLQICLKEAQVSLDIMQAEKCEVCKQLECIEKDLILDEQQRCELLSSLENIQAERDDLRRDLNENIELSIETQDELRSTQQELKEHKMLVVELRRQLEDTATSNPFNLDPQGPQIQHHAGELNLSVCSQLSNGDVDLQKLQQKVLALDQEKSELHEILENVRAEKDQLKLDLQENIETSNETQEELRGALEELKNGAILLDDLKSQLGVQENLTKNLESDLKHKIFQLEEDLNVMTNERDKLVAEFNNAVDKKLEVDGLISALTAEINDLQEKSMDGIQMSALAEKLKNDESKYQELEAAHQNLICEMEALQGRVKAAEVALEKAQQEKAVDAQMLCSLTEQQTVTCPVEVKDMDESLEEEINIFEEKSQVMSLKVELEQTKSENQLDELVQDQARLQSEVENLLKKLNDAESILKSLQREKNETEQALGAIKSQMEAVTLERDELKTTKTSLMETLTQERDELIFAQENLISERDQLKEDLKENIEMSIETQDDLRQAQEELQQQNHKVHEMTSQMALLEEKLAFVEKQVAEKETLLRETLGDRDLHANAEQELDLKVEQLKQALTYSESTLEQVKQEKDEALKRVPSLTAEMGTMSEERCHLQEEVKKLKEESELLKHERGLLEALHSDVNKQLKELVCQIEQLKGKLQHDNSRALQLEDENDSLQKQIQQQDLKISSLNLEQDQFQQLLQRVRGEKESLYSELQSQEKLSSQLTEELNNCHSELQAIKQKNEIEHHDVRVKLDGLSQQISSLQQEIQQLQQTVAEEKDLNFELRDEIECKDKDILLLNLKLSLPPEEEVDEHAERMDTIKSKTQEITDLLVKMSDIFADQHSLINNLSSEIQNEAETAKTDMCRIKDFLSPTLSKSFKIVQTEHVQLNSQLQTVISKIKMICANAAVKKEQYNLIKDLEEELISEQKKHDELELQIQCLEQHGIKWSDSAAADLKFYELEFLSKILCKKYDLIKHVEEDLSEIQGVLYGTGSILRDEVQCKQSFYLWLKEFNSLSIDSTKLNDGIQQENKRIIGIIQLMTKKLKVIIQLKTQRAVSDYNKQMQIELEKLKEQSHLLSRRIQHTSPSVNTNHLEENARLQENLRSVQAELKKMQSRLKTLEEELNASRAETRQKEEQVSSMQRKLLSNTAETELAKIRAQLTKKETSCQNLLTEIQSLQSRVAKGAEPYQEEIDNLKTQVVKGEMERMKMSKSMAQEIESLKSCVEEKEECLRKLKEQLRLTQKACDTSVCSDQDLAGSSNFPLTCGGGSGIVQSMAILVLQSEKSKLESELSYYKKRYSQRSRNLSSREDKKIKVSETPASNVTAQLHMMPSSQTAAQTLDPVSPTKTEFPKICLASPGKTGMKRKLVARLYKAEDRKLVPTSPSKTGRHSVASPSSSKTGILPKCGTSPDRTSVPLLSPLTSSPCKNANLLKTLASPKSKFFDARSKSLPYCPSQFFDNSTLGSLPDVKNNDAPAENAASEWWDENKEKANECKTS